jgi:hypothetical protein
MIPFGFQNGIMLMISRACKDHPSRKENERSFPSGTTNGTEYLEEEYINVFF